MKFGKLLIRIRLHKTGGIVEMTADTHGTVGNMHFATRVASPPIGPISAKPSAPDDRMTRYSLSRRIKLSRLAPPSESIERLSPCGISGLVEGGNMAPGLLDDWHSTFKASLGYHSDRRRIRHYQVAAIRGRQAWASTWRLRFS